MKESAYLPVGAASDYRAPYNRIEPDEIEFNVLCSQTLSKTVPVITNNYTPICETEIDSDGYPCIVPDTDTSNTDWKEEFHDNNHYTPSQLIRLFKQYLQEELEGTAVIRSKEHFERLIKECDGWTEDETVYQED